MHGGIMNEQNKYKDTSVWKEADKLVESVVSFSDSLPKSELYELKSRLKMSVVNVPPTIEEGFLKTKKVDKIRNWIKANGILEECRDYLKMVEDLKYADTDDIMQQLNNFGELLKSNYSFTKNQN
jgi:four helix bundle protein